jgi:hypothetical protein
VKELMMSWVHKKMMSSEEVMTNDGSRNGGEDERKVEAMAAKLYRKTLITPSGDGLVISGVQERSSGWK